MKTRAIKALLIAFILCVSGCCPVLCFVPHGEAYRTLAFPKPHLEKWEKPGATPEIRLRASQDCGGGNTNNPGFGAETVQRARKAGESTHEAYARLFRDYQRCLIAKGYTYVGECPDNEVTRMSPACGAP